MLAAPPIYIPEGTFELFVYYHKSLLLYILYITKAVAINL